VDSLETAVAVVSVLKAVAAVVAALASLVAASAAFLRGVAILQEIWARRRLKGSR
jgi:hypothetical protein